MTLASTLKELQEPGPFRFTRDEYYRLADEGFFQNRRVELIDGEIFDTAPQRDLHAVTIGLVAVAVQRAFPNDWVRQQLPLSFGVRTDPEPDIAVVRGTPRDYARLGHHPSEALLIVEISERSLRYDRQTKSPTYAAAHISEYWIVNLVDGIVEVRRDPTQVPGDPIHYEYQKILSFKPGDWVAPLAAPTAQIPVADLLP